MLSETDSHRLTQARTDTHTDTGAHTHTHRNAHTHTRVYTRKQTHTPHTHTLEGVQETSTTAEYKEENQCLP